MPATVTLAELMAKNVSLQSHEAVAIVRELCDVITQRSATPFRCYVPRLDEVEICSGDLWIATGGTFDEHPVKRLGELLQALLTDTTGATELRLIASQATFQLPSFPSIKEFSQRLEPLERPGRADAIRAVYERWSGSSSDDPVVESPKPPPRGESRAKRLLLPAFGVWLVVTAVLVVAVSVSAVSRRNAGAPPMPPMMSRARTLVSAAGRAIRDTATAAVPALARWMGPDAPAAGSTEPPPDPDSPATSAQRRGGVNSTDSAAIPERTSGVTAVLGATSDPPRSAGETDRFGRALQAFETSPGDAQREERPSSPSTPGNAEGGTAAGSAAEPRVYTSRDTDVVPPVPLRQMLPSGLPPGLRAEEVGVLELLINETGEVETVTLRSPLNRFHDAVMVSAAKAWRYRPAIRNGQPVKYRQTVPVTLPD